MTEFIADLFRYEFLRNALLAAVMVSTLTGMFSNVVVLRKVEFIGDGAAHAAFGGIAFALLFGVSYQLTALITAGVFAVSIGYFTRKRKISESSVIGMLLPLSMALGIIMLSFIRGFTPDITGFLFGNILLVTRDDIWMLVFMNIGAVAFFALFFRELQYCAFDERMARHYGVPTTLVHYAVLIGVSMSVVASVKIAGVILVTAFLVTPAVTSKLVAGRFKSMVLLSVIFGLIATTTGMVTSYWLDIPPGPTIVLMLFVQFLIVFFFEKILRRQSGT